MRMHFPIVKRRNPLLRALMWLAWPTEAVQLFPLQVYAVRVEQDCETFVSVTIGA